MEQLTWKNAQGIDIFAQNWPVEQPAAVIALVHGQGEHIGRYAHVAGWYNRHGIALMGFDQQGHGQTPGPRGHVAGFEHLLNDIDLFLQKVQAQYPGVPVFLYGHSMGGGLCLRYLAERKPALDGCIITSPWIRLAFEAPAFKVIMGRLLRHLLPSLTLPTGLASHFISHDPAVVKAYNEDPLVHGKVSAAAGIALLDGLSAVNTFSGSISSPLLLMHGGDDRITSAKASAEFANRVQGDVTHKEWPGLYHEMHNEPEKEQLFNWTLQWIKQHLPASGTLAGA